MCQLQCCATCGHTASKMFNTFCNTVKLNLTVKRNDLVFFQVTFEDFYSPLYIFTELQYKEMLSKCEGMHCWHQLTVAVLYLAKPV